MNEDSDRHRSKYPIDEPFHGSGSAEQNEKYQTRDKEAPFLSIPLKKIYDMPSILTEKSKIRIKALKERRR